MVTGKHLSRMGNILKRKADQKICVEASGVSEDLKPGTLYKHPSEEDIYGFFDPWAKEKVVKERPSPRPKPQTYYPPISNSTTAPQRLTGKNSKI